MDHVPTFLRHLFLHLAFLSVGQFASAQQIDSVHVFKELPPGHYNTASANAMAWKMHQLHAPYTTVLGKQLAAVTEAMKGYKTEKHLPADLPDLTYLAMAYSGGRVLAFGVADDLDLVINFTARTEYRISSLADHLKVRATLVEVLGKH